MAMTQRHAAAPSDRVPPEFMNLPSPSFIFSILPSTVQGRLSRVQSFRTSSTYSSSSSRKSKSTLLGFKQRRNESPDSGAISGTQTPPPAYNSSAFTTETANMEMALERSAYYSEQEQVSDLDRPASSDSNSSLGQPESQTGIAWKFANQGLNLLGMSVSEASTISQDASDKDVTNAAFSRQLYVHGLGYLLKALPSNLTPEEEMSLRSSLPAQIQSSNQARNPQHLLSGPSSTEDAQPSFLHKTLASTIIQLFLLLQFVLPHLKLLIQNAWDYERSHHLSERLFARSLDTFDLVGKRGVELGDRVSKLGDGRVGQILNAIMAWWVLGVVGGVCEGFGEGVRIVKTKKGGV